MRPRFVKGSCVLRRVLIAALGILLVGISWQQSPADADGAPSIDQRLFATLVAGPLLITGSELGHAGWDRVLRFHFDGTTIDVRPDDPVVRSWSSDAIDLDLPVDVRPGIVQVIVDGVASDPLDLLVYEYVSYKLPSGPGASEFPLTLDRDDTGKIWIIEEAHSHLKWLEPATETSPARTGSIRVPQAAGNGIFAFESGGVVARTKLSGRGEDISVDSAGNIWFTQGGGGYVSKTPGIHNVSRVVRYAPSTGTFACFATPLDYGAIIGLHVDEQASRVWYSSEPSDSLWSFDPALAPSDCLWDPYSQPWPQACTAGQSGACHSAVLIPGYYPSLAHLAAAADGAIWFTHYWGTAVGRYDPASGAVDRIPLPPQIAQTFPGWLVGSGPWELSFDSSGDLWVSEFFDGTLVRIRTADMENGGCLALIEGANPCVDEMFVGSDGSDSRYLHSVKVADDGIIWFTHGDAVGIVSPSHGHAAVTIPIPQAGSSFGGIVGDPGTGGAWFTEFNAKRVATLRPAVGDADGIDNVIDNCPHHYNPGQENADRDFIDLSMYGRPFNDHTWPMSDTIGDACDDDADNDGLSNAAEAAPVAHGCPSASAPLDPLVRDTDGDMVLDGAECMLGTDPANAASKPSRTPPGDSDRDYLTDMQEILLGTNPYVRDTDGDGLSDGIEVFHYGSNPLLVDSDGDGCSDSIEAASLNSDRSVNSIDLLIIALSYGTSLSPKYAAPIDVNKDGAINPADVGLAASLYGAC
jgi:streptogramin lyase